MKRAGASVTGSCRLCVFAFALFLTACSMGGGGDGGGAGPAPFLELLAGDMGGMGSTDGVGAAARFAGPRGVATDTAGNVYVADYENSTIRRITPAGVVTTLAGTARVSGRTNATGTAALFDHPSGVATDSAGNVYVADYDNSIIRKITPAGVVTTLAGSGSFESIDGTGSGASFWYPNSVATDSAGNVYVAEGISSTIRKITPAGVVTTFAGTANSIGSTDATGAAASFRSPAGVATDSAGNVYVADSNNSTIRRITPAGAVTTFAGTAGVTGSTDATGAAASFAFPAGVATDSADNVYVTDQGNGTIRKITPAGVVTTLAGTAGVFGSTDATGAAASFGSPSGVATDGAGNVFVTDGSTIRKITPAGVVTTFAGTASAFGSTDGTGATARFDFSGNGFFVDSALAIDGAGNIYAADYFNRIIRKITPAGVVTTLAGTAGVFGSTDATGAAASFSSPSGVATDSAGNVFVTDGTTIRKITPTGVVTTFAGTAGVYGHADGTGAAASFFLPDGIATDGAGNIYVSDGNTIRKITPAGVVTTLAGTVGVTGSADGVGAAASFNAPSGLATDMFGNIYVADSNNCTIRRITPAGVVTTLAGTAGLSASIDATGPAARFGYPLGIATDGANNVYVADFLNHTIRKVTSAGVVTTVAGVPGQAGFEPGDLPGLLSFPVAVAVSGTSLYVTLYNGVAVVQNLTANVVALLR